MEKITLSINTEVYFLDWYSLKIYETYYINSNKIIKYLGYFQIRNDTVIFKGAKNVHLSMVKRRNNFYGIQLKGMLNLDSPLVHFPNDFTSKVKYFHENETYDMTDISTGIYIDVLHSIEKMFNFTTKLYR